MLNPGSSDIGRVYVKASGYIYLAALIGPAPGSDPNGRTMLGYGSPSPNNNQH